MSGPSDPEQPARPSQQPQSPPPWRSGPAVPPPAGGGQQPYASYYRPGPGQPPQEQPPKRSWVRRHKILTGIGAFVLVGAIGSAFGGSGGSGGKQDVAAPAASATKDSTTGTQLDPNYSPPPSAPPAPTSTGIDVPAPTKAAPTTQAKPKLTTSQEQAIGSAESYLGFKGFSRKGLIQQLSSSAGDGFSVADATYAVDHIEVSWKDQAVRSAKDYLEFTHFSRAGLIQQLSSSAGEGFTRAEATYAADKVGL